jgi:hypothetical protein
MIKVNVRTWRTALLAIAVLMISGGLLQAQPVMIPASEAVGPPPSVDGTGLVGSWFYDPADPGRPCANIAAAQAYIASEPPYGTFSASFIAYQGSDTTPINQVLSFLGQQDANTLKPADTTDLFGTSIFDMKGYIKITDADVNALFGLYTDDGSVVLLGQSSIQAVINDGTHGGQDRRGQVMFGAPGLYPIEVIYFNQAGGSFQYSGICLVYSSIGVGGILPANRLYPSIPAE